MSCPICKSKEKKSLYRLCDNMKIMGAGFPETPSFIVKCKKCGLLYMDTKASQKDFLFYYMYGAVAPNYYDMFGQRGTDEYYHHLHELMKPYIDAGSRILDIAGAWGEFAGYMSSLGYRDVTVLEPNEACISNAKKSGIKTLLTDSTAMEGAMDDSFDMVILNHALEHILDVDSTMNNISRVLKDEGYLFIEVPDVEGYADGAAAPFNFLTYEHVLHMSMNDMKNLAGEYGYEILDKGRYYKKVSNYPSIYAVLKKGTKQALACSDEPEKAMLRYLEKSEKTLEHFLKPLRQSGEKLILWGIGASTAILIESFKGCNVTALIDRNPNRQGLAFHINGRQYAIEPPERAGEGTIVILSIPYHDSIERQIREMGLTNKIVALK
ncbi:MAG: class I SAM-dependent methyltransferase [Firmicutes bacterium]|nr:class I SAM-dependent methyltransferase [Bacillota bacterium]